MNNFWKGVLVLGVVLVGVIYYIYVAGVSTEEKQKNVYTCVEKGTTTIYLSKRIIKGDNCSPSSYIKINPEMVAGIRD